MLSRQGTTDAGAGDSKTPTQDAGQKGTPGTDKDGKPAEANGEPPADVELKVPEGFQPDKTLFDGFKASAKELGLKADAAQKLFDLYVSAAQTAEKARGEKFESDWQAQQKSWTEAAQTDKEVGGQALKENLLLAGKVMAKFGSPALDKYLTESGLGNYPELVRFAVRIGKELAEDSLSGSTAGSPVDEASSADALLRKRYPAMHSQNPGS